MMMKWFVVCLVITVLIKRVWIAGLWAFITNVRYVGRNFLVSMIKRFVRGEFVEKLDCVLRPMGLVLLKLGICLISPILFYTNPNSITWDL